MFPFPPFPPIFLSSLSPPIHPLSLLPHQQNQRMMTPSAASDTVSSPPCSGYIHSQKPLMVCVWREENDSESK